MSIRENITWYEKYRPKTFEDYVFVNDTLRQNVYTWLEKREIPNLFIYGSSGTGKSTLVSLLINSLNLDEDSIIINASKTNGIDDVREQVSSFAPLSPLKASFKLIVFEECENLTKDAQNALKMLIEQYNSVCRFIFVCNEPQKINPAIVGRCQTIFIDKMEKTPLCKNIINILNKENIKFNPEILATYINKFYPNIRSIINHIQYNTINGELKELSNNEEVDEDLYKNAWNLFKEMDLMGGRKYISEKFSTEDVKLMYNWLADNIPNFTSDNTQQFQCFLTIKNGLYESLSSIDPEICLSATIVKMIMCIDELK